MYTIMSIKDAKIYVLLLVFISVFVEKGQSDLSTESVKKIIEDIIYKRFKPEELKRMIAKKAEGTSGRQPKGEQFTVALTLTTKECDSGEIEARHNLQQVMGDMVNGAVGNNNWFTAAIPEFNNGYDSHSEYRVLEKLQSNLNKDSKIECLILYTHNSPCTDKCLKETHLFNIIKQLKDVFSKVESTYSALVFDHIYIDDINKNRGDVFNSLKNIPIPTYCCYKVTATHTGYYCALLDTSKDATYQICLDEISN